MLITFIDLLLSLMAFYLLGGVLFSIFFYIKGSALWDDGMVGTSWHFKLIIFPGVILFWGLLLIKLMKKS
ncbi:MAG: hypothetical protein AAF843_01455 [Bacteroidota bacterium]